MPSKSALLLWFALWCLCISTAFALGIEMPLADTQQEIRAKALFHDIRCVVCQGESIADSPAQIAGDMRRTIREQIASGADDDAIKVNLISHYGDSILMKPPLTPATSLLWFGPLIVLAVAFWLAIRFFRHAARNKIPC